MERKIWCGMAQLLLCLSGACGDDEMKRTAAHGGDDAGSPKKPMTGAAGHVAAAAEVAAVPADMRPERVLPDLEPKLLMPDVANGGAALFTDVVKVPPGNDMMFCTYTSFVAKEKLYLHDTKSVQSKFGHHAILQYSMMMQPPGTHECKAGSLEQQQSQIIGGMGEGANIQYPPNVVSEIPAGAQLMINHHWINTSATEVEVQAEMITVPPPADMKDLVIARSLVVQSTGFNVAAHQAGKESVDCKLDHDVQLISVLGHMHEWGAHVKAERLGADPDVLFDYDFTPVMAIHPTVNYYTLEEPYRVKAGDSLRVSCEWNNTTDRSLMFPGEMCVLSAWQIGAPGDAMCFDGKWVLQ